MSRTIRIAVFLSGVGTNFVAIANACRDGVIPGEVVVVFADRECRGIELARDYNPSILTIVLPCEESDRTKWGFHLLELLAPHDLDLICLAGFMRILPENVVNAYAGRILNIHPGLLPKFAGKDPQKRAILQGVRETGNTVHLVTKFVDDCSKVYATDLVQIAFDDSVETLSEKLKVSGYKTYVTAILAWYKEFIDRTQNSIRRQIDSLLHLIEDIKTKNFTHPEYIKCKQDFVAIVTKVRAKTAQETTGMRAHVRYLERELRLREQINKVRKNKDYAEWLQKLSTGIVNGSKWYIRSVVDTPTHPGRFVVVTKPGYSTGYSGRIMYDAAEHVLYDTAKAVRWSDVIFSITGRLRKGAEAEMRAAALLYISKLDVEEEK